MKFYQRLLFALLIGILCILLYFQFYRNKNTKKTIHSKPKSVQESVKLFLNKDPKCNVAYRAPEPSKHIFQRIDTQEKLSKGYVYSAYYDNRSYHSVIVISLLENQSQNLYCVLWYSKNSTQTVKARSRFIPEGSERRFTASFIYCPLPTFLTIPTYVSITTDYCSSIFNLIYINQIGAAEKRPKHNFSVCVTPLNLNYNRVDQLVEMLSINEMLGATHIYFYNHTSGPSVARIFERAHTRGLVTILQWQLPMKVHVWPLPPNYQEEVKYFAQMAMLNDCLYRNMGRSKWVVFADLDEYLIPRRHRNWRELLAESRLASTKALVFRNVFFKTEWPSDPEMAANRTITSLGTLSLLKVRREATVYAPYQRSKLIVNPRAIDMVGVHNVWEFHNGVADVVVLEPEEGLCHHYRFWDGMGETTFVVDKNIFRLREDIIAFVRRNRDRYLR